MVMQKLKKTLSITIAIAIVLMVSVFCAAIPFKYQFLNDEF